MAEHYAPDAELEQHRSRHLAGERPGLLFVHVLGHRYHSARRCPASDGPQSGERRADRDVDVRSADSGKEGVQECLRLGVRLVHLPVRCDQRAPIAHFSSNASTPGSFLPSRSSRRQRDRSACARSMRAWSTSPSSTSESPVSCPSARKKLKHIAPPIKIASAISRKRSITASLSLTFAPPSTTTNGRAGSARSELRTSTSR